MERNKTSGLFAAGGGKAARLLTRGLSWLELAPSAPERGSSYRPYSFRARQEEPAAKAGRHFYGLATNRQSELR
jgi:hypothetical protein